MQEEIKKPDQLTGNWSEVNCIQHGTQKQGALVTVEAHESTRQRVEPHLYQKNHEDHTACKGFTSMTHYKLFHMFSPMPQARRIPDAKAAVDKGWKRLETIPAWKLGKVKSKKEFILEAQRDKRKVHCATLMDMCHLKKIQS